MIKGLPPKKSKTLKTPAKEEVKQAPVKKQEVAEVTEVKKPEVKSETKVPKLKLRSTEDIIKEEETDIEFNPEKDLEFPAAFYEIEGFDAKMFEENVMQLGNELQVEHPKIRNYLKMILTNLHEYAELNHILTEKQIGLIIEGFKVQKKVEINAKKPSKSSATKELNKHSTEEIMNMNW